MSVTKFKTSSLDQHNESNRENQGLSSGSPQTFNMYHSVIEPGQIGSQQSNLRPQPRPRLGDFLISQAGTRILSTLKQLFGGTDVPEVEPEGEFRGAQRIPFVKEIVYVFPHAERHISNQHRDRFPSVLDIFRQNIEQDPQLCRKRMTKTEYKLRMCGSDRTNAHPSILVGHPSNDLKNGVLLMQKLTQSHVREQYCYKVENPGFMIYMWIGSSFQYLGHLTDTLDVSFRDQNWSLPEACLKSEKKQVQSSVPSDSASEPLPNIKPHCVLGPPKGLTEPGDVYRDWALLHFVDGKHDESSVNASTEEPGIIRDGDTDDLRVQVLTSRSQGIMGTMNRIPTYIADSNVPHVFNEVWTVTTITPEFRVGDSGALVVGERDRQVYGYMIAINHSRELYIVPLAVALAQISKVVSSNTPEVFVRLSTTQFDSYQTTSGSAFLARQFEKLFTRYSIQLDKEAHSSIPEKPQGSAPDVLRTTQEDNKSHGLNSADDCQLSIPPPTAESPHLSSSQLPDGNRACIQPSGDNSLSHVQRVTQFPPRPPPTTAFQLPFSSLGPWSAPATAEANYRLALQWPPPLPSPTPEEPEATPSQSSESSAMSKSRVKHTIVTGSKGMMPVKVKNSKT